VVELGQVIPKEDLDEIHVHVLLRLAVEKVSFGMSTCYKKKGILAQNQVSLKETHRREVELSQY